MWIQPFLDYIFHHSQQSRLEMLVTILQHIWKTIGGELISCLKYLKKIMEGYACISIDIWHVVASSSLGLLTQSIKKGLIWQNISSNYQNAKKQKTNRNNNPQPQNNNTEAINKESNLRKQR